MRSRPAVSAIRSASPSSLPLLRDVKHIDRFSPFRAYQRQIEIAPFLRDRATDPVQQTRRVVGDDLEHRVLARVLVVEMDPRRFRLPVAVEHAAFAPAQERRLRATQPATTRSSMRQNLAGGAGFRRRNDCASENSKTSSTRPSGVVMACPRWMSMPKYHSTPATFEQQVQRLVERDDSSAPTPRRGSRGWCAPRRDESPARAARGDRSRRDRTAARVPARQAAQKLGELGLGNIPGRPADDDGEARRVVPHELVAVAERQVIVGVHVQTPEQLFLPRGQRVRAHRLDIDERHEAQHLEELLGADDVREALDDVRVIEIAAEGHVRHLEVMTDQELDGVTRIVGQLEPIERGTRDSHAFPGVIAVLDFPDVVEDERDREQFRGAKLLKEAAKSFPRRRRRVPEPLEAPHGQQRVLSTV